MYQERQPLLYNLWYKFELLKKTSSLVFREQGLGPHLWFTGHNELLKKSLIEESS